MCSVQLRDHTREIWERSVHAKVQRGAEEQLTRPLINYAIIIMILMSTRNFTELTVSTWKHITFFK